MTSQYLGQCAVGDEQRFALTFKTLDGVLSNPTTITVKIAKPSGTTITKTNSDMTNPTPGVWYLSYTPDEGGRWYIRVTSTGAPKIARQGHFDVEQEYPV
ncbi:MAG: hypothetical protein JNJ61_25805 [Anaerolineae bacterium]|nr:hypothetical protein [Anaerolineae bacterium]